MTQHSSFLSKIGPFIDRYLSLKQALGRKYTTERSVLVHLDRFLATQGHKVGFNAETFALWCATIDHLTPGVRRSRMRIARNLCLYRRRSEPTCFVPDPTGFPKPHQPRRPHLFTPQEIVRLLRAANDLRPRSTSPLRREVYRLAIVLLYTTGLRRGELVRLTLSVSVPGTAPTAAAPSEAGSSPGGDPCPTTKIPDATNDAAQTSGSTPSASGKPAA